MIILRVIVDANLFHCFTSSSKKFKIYKPILNWINKKIAQLIIGGTKYKEELKKHNDFLGMVYELEKAGRVMVFQEKDVDQIERDVRKIAKANGVTTAKFNDSHIIALIIISNSNLICSEDKKLHRYIKQKFFYPKGKPPFIYTKFEHYKEVQRSIIRPALRSTRKRL